MTSTHFEYLDHQVEIIERESALNARFSAKIDGVPTGVAFHLESSARDDAKREIDRMVAERRRVTGQAQWKLPPIGADFVAAEEEERERWELCG